MEPIYILIISVFVTAAIFYLIYFSTRSKSTPLSRSSEKKDIDISMDDDFLEDIEDDFNEVKTKKSYEIKDVPDDLPARYPDCFGSEEVYKVCKKNCQVHEECSSTVNILEGF